MTRDPKKYFIEGLDENDDERGPMEFDKLPDEELEDDFDDFGLADFNLEEAEDE